MELKDLINLVADLESQSLSYVFLTIPYPKNRRNNFAKLRTPFGNCEVVSVNPNTGRANIQVNIKQLKKLIKTLDNQLGDC